MKLTKVDGVSHYKKVKIGELKRNSIEKETTENIVKSRFELQIESRIYREFIRINGKGKVYKSDMKSVRDDINGSGVNSLFMLILELYSGIENDEWEKNILDLDLDKIENITKNKTKKYKLQYKLDKKKGQWLFRSKEEFVEGKIPKSFRELLEELKNECKKMKDENIDTNIRKLEIFLKLKGDFIEYKRIKLYKIIKSIEKNKFISRVNNENKIEGITKKEKYFIKLLENILLEIESNELDINPFNSFFMKLYTKETEKLFEDIENVFTLEIERVKKEKLKKVHLKNRKEGIIKYNSGKIKIEISRILADYLKLSKTDSNEFLAIDIYKSEVKKYIKTSLSVRKENAKKQNGEKNPDLYFYLLKKLFFIDKNNNVMNKDKFKNKIEENLKNTFSNHVINYGKVLFYSNKIGKKSFETSDLEYIKANEILVRKLSSLVSFGTYGIYNLLNHEEHLENFEDILGKKKFLCLEKEESAFSLKSNKNKFNYFFDSSLLENKEIIEFISEVSESIYNIRNGVIHFKNIEFTKLENNCSVKTYFKNIKDNAIERVIEKFSSNNLHFYFDELTIRKYLEIYNYSLLKIKVPFAPKFKRIIDKSEKLYRVENKSENKKKYKWFLSKERYGEAEELYLKTKNFLLEELYYNNFLNNFYKINVYLKEL